MKGCTRCKSYSLCLCSVSLAKPTCWICSLTTYCGFSGTDIPEVYCHEKQRSSTISYKGNCIWNVYQVYYEYSSFALVSLLGRSANLVRREHMSKQTFRRRYYQYGESKTWLIMFNAPIAAHLRVPKKHIILPRIMDQVVMLSASYWRLFLSGVLVC